MHLITYDPKNAYCIRLSIFTYEKLAKGMKETNSFWYPTN